VVIRERVITGGKTGPVKDDPRALVDEYNRNLVTAIRESKSRHGYDRLLLYTGIHELFKKVERPGDYRVPFGTGSGLLSQLGDFPGQGIPNLVILSEGWGPSRINGGKGLPISDNSENGFPVTGLYESEATRQEELEQSVNDYMEANAADLRKRFKTLTSREASNDDLDRVKDKTFTRYDQVSRANSAALVDDVTFTNPETGQTETTVSLATRIRKGEARFCKHGIIQLYASNINKGFAAQFARVSGCQIVFCTGKVSGKATGQSADGSPEVTLTSSDGDFVKLTPLRNADGEVYNVYEERLGNSYPLMK